jgi:hypothetical protein
MEIIKKKCKRCKRTKPLSEFPCRYYDRTVMLPEKYDPHCKTCFKLLNDARKERLKEIKRIGKLIDTLELE